MQTTSNNVQDIIESRVEKRTKGVYVPIGGKKLITFLDDFNMPGKDTFGSQPPLELIRLWLDYGFWYDRSKQTVKNIKVREEKVFESISPFDQVRGGNLKRGAGHSLASKNVSHYFIKEILLDLRGTKTFSHSFLFQPQFKEIYA